MRNRNFIAAAGLALAMLAGCTSPPDNASGSASTTTGGAPPTTATSAPAETAAPVAVSTPTVAAAPDLEFDKAKAMKGYADVKKLGKNPVAGDIEACAGTHCSHTGEIGIIKIIRVEHIQDGIERLEFTAGLAGVHHLHQQERLLTSAAEDEEYVPERAVAGLTGWIDCFEKARLTGTVFAGGVSAPGETEGHPSLVRAYEMGKAIKG